MHMANNAVAASPMAKAPRRATGLGTPKVVVDLGGYAVADVETLTDAGSAARYSTETEATQAIAQMQAADPSLAGRLQVVADYELAA